MQYDQLSLGHCKDMLKEYGINVQNLFTLFVKRNIARFSFQNFLHQVYSDTLSDVKLSSNGNGFTNVRKY